MAITPPAPCITVVGLGLIGGSIGLALADEPGVRRIGVDRSPDACKKALAVGAVDAVTHDVAESVRDADLVVLAVPVGAMEHVVRAAAPALKPGAVVTDVGSTKAELCRRLPRLLPAHASFVGGHPLAGSERSGIDAADPYLFANAVYVLTPVSDDNAALQKVRWLVQALGAHPLEMDPEHHDVIVASVSHLPHLAAAALILAVADAAAKDEQTWRLAAGGLRDTTRVASGDPALWLDICLTNQKPIVAALRRLEHRLAQLRAALETNDGEALIAQLAAARAARAHLPDRRKGISAPVFELVVQLAEPSAGLNEVIGRLAANNLRVKDAEDLRVREGAGATLRLGLTSERDVAAALRTLHDAGFRVQWKG